MITFEEPETMSPYTMKGFEFMMDSILKSSCLVHNPGCATVRGYQDNALHRVMNMYRNTSRKLCAIKRIKEIKASKMNKINPCDF